MYRIYKVNDNPVVDYAAEELKKKFEDAGAEIEVK